MDAFELAKTAGRLAEEKKAKDIVILELIGLTDIADYFLIASGRNERHVKTIAEHILESAKHMGIKVYSTEGVENGRWAVIDFSTVVVHLFLQPLRELYDLESLWYEAKKYTFSGEKKLKGAVDG
ncbi:MAG: ribosome silencing factor [Desulfobacterota bacterium]|nr:ribosome silencing factor [Thermodesulfobacteriota bacterium]MDW8002188.1 ribosome silencing factor [Deltaproteobacteria bacterium]